MTATDPSFAPPDDSDIKIWRYVAFAPFVAMLEELALFFPRSIMFSDPYEGTYPHAMMNADVPAQNGMDFGFIMLLIGRFQRTLRKEMLISCWHMNEGESEAMWRLYGQSNQAIAIQSTYARLRSVLDASIHIGVVRYIDYSKELIPLSITAPFMYKRKSFEHERELRAVMWDHAEDGRPAFDTDAEPPPNSGRWVEIDLNQLIETVYVSPQAPQWYKDLVVKVLQRYEIEKPVVRSELDVAPFLGADKVEFKLSPEPDE